MSESDSTVPDGFRVIPGYSRYAINEHGTVLSACGRGCRVIAPNRSWADAKRMNPTTGTGGYHFVTLRHDGNARYISVHALVLTTFVGPCPDGMECRHLDGNPVNNHVSNLAWGTYRENQYDRILHGTDCRGEKCVTAKLTAADVIEIRRRAASGEKQKDIANDFPTTIHNVSLIVRRLSWKHV